MATEVIIYACGAVLTAALVWRRLRKIGKRWSAADLAAATVLWPVGLLSLITADW